MCVPRIHCMGYTLLKTIHLIIQNANLTGLFEFPFAKFDNPECAAYRLLASGDWTRVVGFECRDSFHFVSSPLLSFASHFSTPEFFLTFRQRKILWPSASLGERKLSTMLVEDFMGAGCSVN